MKVLLTALLLILAGVRGPQSGSATVEGIVTRTGSLQPIEGARVFIWANPGAEFEVKTDVTGHYVINNVPANIYTVELQASRFSPVPGPSAPEKIRLTVGEGQRVRRDISMAGLGAINGRVTDEKREPFPRALVEVLKLMTDVRGHLSWRRAGSAATDANGEYHIEGLPTDTYYVRAKEFAASFSPDGRTVQSVPLKAAFYPGTPDFRTAASIRLDGQTDGRADFALAAAQTYSASGEIVNAHLSDIRGTQLAALLQDERTPSETIPAQIDAFGAFVVEGLLPGRYELMTTNLNGRSARTAFEIRDADIKDLKVFLEERVSVSGRFKLLSDVATPMSIALASPQSNVMTLFRIEAAGVTASLQVGLRSRYGDPANPFFKVASAYTGEKPFIVGVPPGSYDVVVSALGPTAFYVADIREGPRSVFDDGLQIAGRSIDSLEIILGTDGGTLEGAIAGTRKDPILVVLAPHPSRRQNPALFKTVILEDAATPFRFAGVAPGLYSVFAFEVATRADVVPYLDRNFLSRIESKGVAVTVEKGGTTSVPKVPLVRRDEL